MSKEFSRAFYASSAWKNTRKAYASSVGNLCERCFRSGRYTPGVIVHHIEHLTPENITNPDVTLNWSNLELLCRDCHKEIHESEMHRRAPRRYHVDKNGRVISV